MHCTKQPGQHLHGLILAHSVDTVPDFVKVVTTSADLETIFYTEGGGLR